MAKKWLAQRFVMVYDPSSRRSHNSNVVGLKSSRGNSTSPKENSLFAPAQTSPYAAHLLMHARLATCSARYDLVGRSVHILPILPPLPRIFPNPRKIFLEMEGTRAGQRPPPEKDACQLWSLAKVSLYIFSRLRALKGLSWVLL
ncbi:hypothetical protein KL907_003640 [Ogataea polymorpha]|nr:hypothetical protein KL907_003640 [Ogataea polymorpha]